MIVVDRYLRGMGDETIPDESGIAGIDLPYQVVVSSYSLPL